MKKSKQESNGDCPSGTGCYSPAAQAPGAADASPPSVTPPIAIAAISLGTFELEMLDGTEIAGRRRVRVELARETGEGCWSRIELSLALDEYHRAGLKLFERYQVLLVPARGIEAEGRDPAGGSGPKDREPGRDSDAPTPPLGEGTPHEG